MSGKIDLYNMGEHGVDVVKSPLHEADGDLFKAQNAHADPAGLEGGIRKRDGMAKVNAVALTGAIEGMYNVPLPAPGTRTYFTGEARGSDNTDPTNPWSSSVAGAAWSGVSQPSQGQIQRPFDSSTPGDGSMVGCVSYKRRLIYPGFVTSGSSPLLRTWDGTRDMELTRVPFVSTVLPAEYIGHMWMHRGVLYLCAGLDGAFTVYRADIVTGATVEVGTVWSNVGLSVWAFFGLSYLDRVWAGGHSGAGLGKLYWIRNGEDDWTLERTAAANLFGYTHGANYKGDLYVGTYVLTPGTAAIVEKRAASTGTWTTSKTGSVAGAVNYWTCFAVFNDLLFAVYKSGATHEVWRYDGSTWTLDLDITAAGHASSVQPGGVLAETDALYIAFGSPRVADADGYVLKRTTGAVWSKPISGLVRGNATLGFLP